MQVSLPTGGVQLSQGPSKGEDAAVEMLTIHGDGVFGMRTVSAPERIVAWRQALLALASVGCQQSALATVLCRAERAALSSVFRALASGVFFLQQRYGWILLFWGTQTIPLVDSHSAFAQDAEHGGQPGPRLALDSQQS